MLKRVLFFALVAVALAILLPRPAMGEGAPPFKIIVHPSNPTRQASRKFLTEAFLKKTTRWSHGPTIHPADLVPDSQVRQRFSEDVLKRSVAAVKNYWQQIIFSGRGVPPPELPNDEEMVKYVLKHEGGIGYVSGTADIGDAHVVTVQ